MLAGHLLFTLVCMLCCEVGTKNAPKMLLFVYFCEGFNTHSLKCQYALCWTFESSFHFNYLQSSLSLKSCSCGTSFSCCCIWGPNYYALCQLGTVLLLPLYPQWKEFINSVRIEMLDLYSKKKERFFKNVDIFYSTCLLLFLMLTHSGFLVFIFNESTDYICKKTRLTPILEHKVRRQRPQQNSDLNPKWFTPYVLLWLYGWTPNRTDREYLTTTMATLCTD